MKYISSRRRGEISREGEKMLNIQTKLLKNQKIYEDLLITRKSFVGSKTGVKYYSYMIKSDLKGE